MAAKAGNTKGYVGDGFPVTMDQDMIGAPTKIVAFQVNDKVMKIRLKERSNLMTNQSQF